MYEKISLSAKLMPHFVKRTFRWNSDNVWQIWNKMSSEDKQLFNFDLALVDFKEHLMVCKLGLKYYFFKDKMENLPAAVRRNNRSVI